MSSRYFLIEIDGDEAFLRGYVEGYFRARNLDVSGVYFGSDYGLDDERFLTRLRNFIGLKVEHNLLVMREEFRVHLEEAITRLPERWRIAVKAAREVREIRFPFRVETASREVAGRLKAMLEGLLEGVRLEGASIREEQSDEGFETAAYAPDHPYRFWATGTLAGAIEPTLKAYRMLADFEHVEFDEPEFTFA